MIPDRNPQKLRLTQPPPQPYSFVEIAFRFMSRLPFLLSACIVGALLSSCGTVDTIKDGAVSGVSSVGSGFNKMGAGFARAGQTVGSGFGAVADAATSPFKPGLPVVEAREEDLRKIPSGHEQALAYQKEQQRRRGWWIFGGPVDFEEPSLPDSPVNAEAGLLPPLE